VVVTNYLWRPLAAPDVDSVAPGGVLIYETFAAGNETVGKPSRADFLLRPGELLQAARCAPWPTKTATWTGPRAVRAAHCGRAGNRRTQALRRHRCAHPWAS
jgi:hypothetical protein